MSTFGNKLLVKKLLKLLTPKPKAISNIYPRTLRVYGNAVTIKTWKRLVVHYIPETGNTERNSLGNRLNTSFDLWSIRAEVQWWKICSLRQFVSEYEIRVNYNIFFFHMWSAFICLCMKHMHAFSCLIQARFVYSLGRVCILFRKYLDDV